MLHFYLNRGVLLIIPWWCNQFACSKIVFFKIPFDWLLLIAMSWPNEEDDLPRLAYGQEGSWANNSLPKKWIAGPRIADSQTAYFESGFDSKRQGDVIDFDQGGISILLGGSPDWHERNDSSSSGAVATSFQWGSSFVVAVTQTDVTFKQKLTCPVHLGPQSRMPQKAVQFSHVVHGVNGGPSQERCIVQIAPGTMWWHLCFWHGWQWRRRVDKACSCRQSIRFRLVGSHWSCWQ